MTFVFSISVTVLSLSEKKKPSKIQQLNQNCQVPNTAIAPYLLTGFQLHTKEN